jgi:hypothetical protein
VEVKLFHGTDRKFKSFKLAKGTTPSKVGVWMTDSYAVAEKFARMVGGRMADGSCFIVEADVVLHSPLVFDDYAGYLTLWRENGDSAKLRRQLLRTGHDAIVISRSTTDFPIERKDVAILSPGSIGDVKLHICEAA